MCDPRVRILVWSSNALHSRNASSFHPKNMGPFTRRWYSHIRFRRFRLRLLTALAKSVIIEFVKWLRHHIPALRGGETSSNMRLSPSIVGPLDAASPVHRTTHHFWPFDQDLYADVAVFLLCGVSILISSAFSARIVLRVKNRRARTWSTLSVVL